MTGGVSFLASLGLYLAYRAAHQRYWIFGSVTLKTIAEAVEAACGTLVAVEGIIMSPHAMVYSWKEKVLVRPRKILETSTPIHNHPLELGSGVTL
mmetsp:Transcript_3269/g.6355  ORF Transcript_3269/g.6355 Transcript_3269/m.6355 type:complete len:95 (+) Transcript_3269:276-560(+)